MFPIGLVSVREALDSGREVDDIRVGGARGYALGPDEAYVFVQCSVYGIRSMSQQSAKQIEESLFQHNEARVCRGVKRKAFRRSVGSI